MEHLPVSKNFDTPDGPRSVLATNARPIPPLASHRVRVNPEWHVLCSLRP